MNDGTLFRDYLASIGILPGIKVDKGAKDLSCHPRKITEGLDGLRDRLALYYENGASFKWRAVITIANDIPSDADESNMNALARYASCVKKITYTNC